MPTNEYDQGDVTAPSIGAILYQALTLKETLLQLTKEEYPPQTCLIRDVFLCLVGRICEELEGLLNVEETEPNIDRSIELGANTYEIFSYIRYLKASSPQKSPPGIQLAIAELTKLYFPTANGTPVCLVRPQWSYNLGYVDLSAALEDLIELKVLNPRNDPPVNDKKELLPALWKRKNAAKEGLDAQEFPKQLAVLSFAALDTNDILLYPILAHELGHFIDYSFRPNYLHNKAELYAAAQISTDLVQKNLGLSADDAEQAYLELSAHADVCLREIIADLLAVRMMGISYFLAQAEYLKTIAAWPGKTIEPSGYPGLKFRLSIVFDHLKLLPEEINIFTFIKGNDNPSARFLASYLADWEKELETATALRSKQQAEDPINGYLGNGMRSAISEFYSIAKNVIPDAICARLTPEFFHRISNLQHDLPPSCQVETRNAFSEILSAAWVYQLQYGESEEKQLPTIEKKHNEYLKTCNLILKAIELIPFSSLPEGEKDDSHSGGTAKEVDARFHEPHGVLGKGCILQRIKLPPSNKSSIKAIPFNHSALNTVSLDLRLGNWFTVARKPRVRGLRIGGASSDKLLLLAREEIFIPHKHEFVIHPGDLVLGTSLEFVALPGNVMAYVEGKSKLGRLGLIIATASKIDPGFHGVIVLEMVNAGTVPLVVEPGAVVAQLIFQGLNVPLEREDWYKKDYYCQIKP